MKTISGKENIRKNLPDILSDESRFTLGTPETVFFPRTTADIQEIAREASRKRIPVTIIGAHTGITGGSVPIDNCIAACFSEMNRILKVRPDGNGGLLLACQPGVTLKQIQAFLEAPDAWPLPVEGKKQLLPGAWLYPPDPTEMTAQLGGTVATNASGSRSYHFGPTRSNVEALSLVFAGGDTITLKRGEHHAENGFFNITTGQGAARSFPVPEYQSPAIKNAAGYYSKKGMDLIDLIIGSEGTLAIFTEITVCLLHAPNITAGLSFFPGLGEAFTFAGFLRTNENIAAIEYFDESALAFVRKHPDMGPGKIPAYPRDKKCAVYWEYMETLESPFEEQLDKWENALSMSGSSFEATWSGFDKKEMEFLRQFRHLVPESINAAIAGYKRECPMIRKISTDAAFSSEFFLHAMEQYISFARSARLEYALFGHLGDFHLHLNLLPHDADEFERALEVYEKTMDLAIACKGTISAEHGIGKIKRPYLMKMCGERAVREMMRIKSALDPLWLLNPGNLFEPPVP
ncbi:MAG: FAD-binding oxidoreductase [Chitinivibrionales bacterium]